MPVVKFWLNAFIPRDVPGYTKLLSKGPHVGKTAIPLPGVARTWPGNTFKDWDAGYLTDQRSFDPAPGASARMKSMVEVELLAPVDPAMARQSHTSSGTTEVNLTTGAQTGYAVADMSRCQFALRPAPLVSRPGGFGAHLTVAHSTTLPIASLRRPGTGVFGSITLDLYAAAGDPLVGMAADIDYAGKLTIYGGAVLGSVIVSFEGTIDEFPAYDCYASYNGTTKEVFKANPPPGNTVTDLLGASNRPVHGSARFP